MSEPGAWLGRKGGWREGTAGRGTPKEGQGAEPAGEEEREARKRGAGECKARGSSLPAPRLKEILASARYGVSLLERTLLMGRRSISSSEDAAINVGGRSRVARRAEREKEMEREKERGGKGEEGKGRGSHTGRGEGRGGWERKGRGRGGRGKRGEKGKKRRERERKSKGEKRVKGEKENPLRICGLEQRSGYHWLAPRAPLTPLAATGPTGQCSRLTPRLLPAAPVFSCWHR